MEWIKNNPDGVVFWFLPRHSWQDHVYTIFADLVREFGFGNVDYFRYWIKIGNAKIIFKPVSTHNPYTTSQDIREAVRGYKKVLSIYESLYEYTWGNR